MHLFALKPRTVNKESVFCGFAIMDLFVGGNQLVSKNNLSASSIFSLFTEIKQLNEIK